MLFLQCSQKGSGCRCFDTGLFVLSTNVHMPVRKPSTVMYRIYKIIESEKYNVDLSCASFHFGEIFNSIDDSYWYYKTYYKGIIDEHAPLKCKTIVITMHHT